MLQPFNQPAPLQIYTCFNGWIVEVPARPIPLPQPMSYKQMMEMQSEAIARAAKQIKGNDRADNLGIEEESQVAELLNEALPKENEDDGAKTYVFTDFQKLTEFLLPYLKNGAVNV